MDEAFKTADKNKDGKMTGKMEKYSNMRTNAAKSIGFSALEAAAKIAVPALFVVAENEELSNNDTVAEVQRQIAARGVPSKYHVIKGITHYGIYREGFQEASTLEIAALPMSGPAWEQLKAEAEMPAGAPRVSDQDQMNNVRVLAKARVFARTGEERFRTEVRQQCMAAIGTGRGGRTLALGRICRMRPP